NAEPDVFSPLAQLPGNLASGYVVQTSGYYGPKGSLTVGLTDELRKTFKVTTKLAAQKNTLPNGKPAWEDAKINVCYTLEATDIKNECALSIVDTGATAFFWNTKGLKPDQLDGWGDVKGGMTLTVQVPGMDESWKIDVTNNPVPGIDM